MFKNNHFPSTIPLGNYKSRSGKKPKNSPELSSENNSNGNEHLDFIKNDYYNFKVYYFLHEDEVENNAILNWK